MKLRQLFTDDDAVSPVIGVILMVAITVILAAVIGAFVMGFSPGDSNAPSANWDVDEDSGNNSLTFTHEGGEDINGEFLTAGANMDDTRGNTNEPHGFNGSVAGEVFSTGDSFTVYVDSDADPGDEVTVAYSEGDGSQVVATHTLSASW